MTYREAILRTFRREPTERLVWQPRIYYWYYGNGLPNDPPAQYIERGRPPLPIHVDEFHGPPIPEEFRTRRMIDLYRLLPASPRYPQETLRVQLFQIHHDDSIRIYSEESDGRVYTVFDTPVGQIREASEHAYKTEYLLKSPQDFKVMAYVLEHSHFEFWDDAFQVADQEFGDLGVVTTFYPRSPLQRLIVEWMGFENVVYALNDYRTEVEDLMRAIEAWDDHMYEVLLSSPLQILNFGENIDANVDPPSWFEQYLAPYYEKRIKQIHAAGKFCHIHIDGAMKPLLPYIRQLEFDGIEAATPLPQGDVTLEELKEALAGKILLDGIPAILFLPSYPEDQFQEFVLQVIDMFWPNLILGISDELPPSGDIRRVKWVSDSAENWKPPVQ